MECKKIKKQKGKKKILTEHQMSVYTDKGVPEAEEREALGLRWKTFVVFVE